MALDYFKIKSENEVRYGTDIGRIGPMLLANRYDDRTHFIFELLQNAEDALARRPDWKGSRAVKFSLSGGMLRVSHCGKAFDDRDVHGICGIAESTKDLTAIGRFGIGFKSVYAFTDRPEVHSGNEDFAIESFVWPTAIPALDHQADETVFVFPLRKGDEGARTEITEGLRRLGARTLLFLRHIDEIDWSVEGGPSGLYVRGKPEEIGEDVHRIILLGEEHGKPEVEETWLLFSREAKTLDGVVAGRVEIAFSIDQEKKTDRWLVRAVSDSPLVVFFPTVLPTHLGFLVQGPYRTTPSRDNVPRSDPWNQHLIRETSELLVDTLRLLRDQGMFDTDALRCLPLDRTKFHEGSMFSVLFETVRTVLKSEPLLPRFGGGHVPASQVKLARTQELRELFNSIQLGTLFGDGGELAWLSSDITQDRTPELKQYLMRELEIVEVTFEAILPKLNKAFLEVQLDKWILGLYESLNNQPALRRRVSDLPLIRLQDGSHVVAQVNGQPQAFLPGAIETGFPTVCKNVCVTNAAREFIRSLGLTEPDPVDDVIWNILPKFCSEVGVDDQFYEADIRRILAAFGTDSKAQREKLLTALRESYFVIAVDAGDGSKCLAKPGDQYIPTQRLKELFEGVTGVTFVDDTYSCLRGEGIRDLLEACGAALYLHPVLVETKFTWEERSKMRREGGCKDCSREYPIENFTLRGLQELLTSLPALIPEVGAKKASLLWEALCDVEDRRGTRAFSGTYRWDYHYQRSITFDADFVRLLNKTAWVPDKEGTLQPPEYVVFEDISPSWKPNAFLLSKICFKPPIIEALAREAGIEPGVLDLLKKHGVKSVADLVALLGITEEPEQPSRQNVDDAVKNILGDAPGPTPPVPDPTGSEPQRSGGSSGSVHGMGSGGGGDTSRGSTGDGKGGGGTSTTGTSAGKRTAGSAGGRPFISYVGTHAEADETDLDGLDQPARMALEEQAIMHILLHEPELTRTPTNNLGFDLVQMDPERTPIRWIEVKAMTGSLMDRPVGLSRTQFECAQEHGDSYWVYAVEHAGSSSARIVRIQDPAGKARTFTFDHGWLGVAELTEAERSNLEQQGSE
jgi:hypothetical protein